MSDLPNGFQSGDLYVFPMGPAGSGNFGYIPGEPSIEMSGGNAKAALLASPAGGVLSIQAIWEAPSDAVDAAQNEIPSRYPEFDGGIYLNPAPIEDVTATLTVTPPGGAGQTFGPKETSGPDSYRVVFSETLPATEKLAAMSAFRGQRGILQIRYSGTLVLDESVKVTISGDLADALKTLAPKPPEQPGTGGGWFSKKKAPDPPAPPPDPEACAAAVEATIADGTLKIEVVKTANIPDEMTAKIESDLRARAAGQLFDKLTQLGFDAAYVSGLPIRFEAEDGKRIDFRIARETDPADWLGQNGGARLVSDTAVSL